MNTQEPDNTKVICPQCCNQFRAIPVQVQSLMIDVGLEPPFTSLSAQPAAQVPEGWMLVPIEPTQDMAIAGFSKNIELGGGKRNPTATYNMSEELNLLPCPFCGGTDIEPVNDPHQRPFCVCLDCYAQTIEDTKEEAIAAWNRRPAPALELSDEGIDAVGREVFGSTYGVERSRFPLRQFARAILAASTSKDSPAYGEKYAELILAVCRKFPNEGRHETALRYIREAEKSALTGSAAMGENNG